MYPDATIEEIECCLQKSHAAFQWFSKCPASKRRELLYAIADEIENSGDELLSLAASETKLPMSRLRLERSRTIKQLKSYGDYAASGHHLDLRIDTAQNDQQASRPDIRKMNIPIGPVVVFGASNFPFAYSTAGGDTASALAAGCTVIVKAHPAHASTSQMVADAISRAIGNLHMPEGVFQHVHGASPTAGEALVKHPITKAVGFTGSYEGGKQIFDWGNQRQEPIPVFAEMGSTNPVFLFPKKLREETEQIASMYADSISQGAGQFCTNPGILVALKDKATDAFAVLLAQKLDTVAPASMLHEGIYERYHANKSNAASQPKVKILTLNDITENHKRSLPLPVIPTLAKVPAEIFLKNKILHREVFGPFSLLVVCDTLAQMKETAAAMTGQLTSSLLATEKECGLYADIIEVLQSHCGRIILNGVPTGVEVVPSMQHGGPFPATTDSRFTAVGPDAIRRFVRPLCFQNWPNQLLPDELKNENPLGYRRMVNGEWL